MSADEGDDVVVQQGEVYLTTGSGERKTTGSYYTPEYVVEYIVENTLEPLVDDIRTDLAGQSAWGDDRGFAEEFEWLSFEGFEIPDQVTQGETIEVTGTVANTGDDETLQVLKMTVDADVVEANEIDLKPGKSTEMTFDHTFKVAGEYSVTIEDLGPWTVRVPDLGETGN